MPSPEASNSRSLELFNKATRPRISAAVISRVATCAQVIFGIKAVCCHDLAASNPIGCRERRYSRCDQKISAWQAWYGLQTLQGVSILTASYGLHEIRGGYTILIFCQLQTDFLRYLVGGVESKPSEPVPAADLHLPPHPHRDLTRSRVAVKTCGVASVNVGL